MLGLLCYAELGARLCKSGCAEASSPAGGPLCDCSHQHLGSAFSSKGSFSTETSTNPLQPSTDLWHFTALPSSFCQGGAKTQALGRVVSAGCTLAAQGQLGRECSTTKSYVECK